MVISFSILYDNIFFDILFFHGLSRTIHSILLHLLRHVSIFNHGFLVRYFDKSLNLATFFFLKMKTIFDAFARLWLECKDNFESRNDTTWREIWKRYYRLIIKTYLITYIKDVLGLILKQVRESRYALFKCIHVPYAKNHLFWQQLWMIIWKEFILLINPLNVRNATHKTTKKDIKKIMPARFAIHAKLCCKFLSLK